MSQKVIQIGTSAGITMPKAILAGLGIGIGDRVAIHFNAKTATATIKPEAPQNSRDARIAKLTGSFIDRYRDDLKALSQK